MPSADPFASGVIADWLDEFGDEEAWQEALDARIEDQVIRSRFSQWLSESDDPRAAGYAELAKLDRKPYLESEPPGFSYRSGGFTELDKSELPANWMGRFDEFEWLSPGYYAVFTTRREAEDAAAFAFFKPPANSPKWTEALREFLKDEKQVLACVKEARLKGNGGLGRYLAKKFDIASSTAFKHIRKEGWKVNRNGTIERIKSS